MIIKLEPYKRKKQKPKIKSEIEEAINDLEIMAVTWRASLQFDRPDINWPERIELAPLEYPDIQEIA